MAFYFGGQSHQIHLGGIKCRFEYNSNATIETNGVALMTSDGFALKDSNGALITVKEDE